MKDRERKNKGKGKTSRKKNRTIKIEGGETGRREGLYTMTARRIHAERERHTER